MPSNPFERITFRGQEGQVLVSVLAVFLLLTLTAWAFVALMNSEQRLAGDSYRAMAALYLAEAGVERVLWELGHEPILDGNGNGNGHLVGYQEQLGAGSFLVEDVTQQGGILVVTVRGEVGGVVRRVRRVARIAPQALAYSIFGGDLVLAGSARTYIAPLQPHLQSSRRLGDVAAFKTLWFEAGTVFNALDGRRIATRDQITRDFELFGLPSASFHSSLQEFMPDLVLMLEAQLLFGSGPWRLYSADSLHRENPAIHVRRLRVDEASLPAVDVDTLRAMARSNPGNAPINREVGERALDRALREKQDSLYTPEEFARILNYLGAVRQDQSRTGLAFAGVVFVEGAVSVLSPLAIDDGALIVNGTLHIADGMQVTIRHSVRASALPGLIVVGPGGAIRVGRGASLVADGLVYTSGGLEVLNGTLDVSGAVMAGQGFINDGGLTIVRYDASVLQTLGVELTRDVLVRPLAWEDLR